MRRIITELHDDNSNFDLTVTGVGEKTGIVMTIEHERGDVWDIKVVEARKIYDALGKALGE